MIKTIKHIAWVVIIASISLLIISIAEPDVRERTIVLRFLGWFCDTIISVFGVTVALILISSKMIENGRSEDT